jgi:hypothetical protein
MEVKEQSAIELIKTPLITYKLLAKRWVALPRECMSFWVLDSLDHKQFVCGTQFVCCASMNGCINTPSQGVKVLRDIMGLVPVGWRK